MKDWAVAFVAAVFVIALTIFSIKAILELYVGIL